MLAAVARNCWHLAGSRQPMVGGGMSLCRINSTMFIPGLIVYKLGLFDNLNTDVLGVPDEKNNLFAHKS